MLALANATPVSFAVDSAPSSVASLLVRRVAKTVPARTGPAADDSVALGIVESLRLRLLRCLSTDSLAAGVSSGTGLLFCLSCRARDSDHIWSVSERTRSHAAHLESRWELLKAGFALHFGQTQRNASLSLSLPHLRHFFLSPKFHMVLVAGV